MCMSDKKKPTPQKPTTRRVLNAETVHGRSAKIELANEHLRSRASITRPPPRPKDEK